MLNRLYGFHRDVNEELVNYAISEIISDYSYSYADLMKAYPSSNIRLLKAIAKEGCVKEILSGNFLTKYRLRAASSVSTSLKKLTENELVYKTDKGYIIYDRIMDEWLRNQPF